MIQFVLHWFAIHTGTDAPGDHWYNFWSGFGSDVGEVTLLSILLGGWRHMNCHVAHCWRVGRYPIEGTPFRVCRFHHPLIDKAPTSNDILVAHVAAQERKSNDGNQPRPRPLEHNEHGNDNQPVQTVVGGTDGGVRHRWPGAPWRWDIHRGKR